MEHWKVVAGPEHAHLTAEIHRLNETVVSLRERSKHRGDWLERHPEALTRLHRLERDLEALHPAAPVDRVVGYESPSRDVGPEVRGPDLGLGL
jgi:hypothetical protein